MRPVTIIAWAFSSLLCGCAGFSDLHHEATPMPLDVREIEESSWWKTFNDPQLDSLVLEAISGSPDIRQAQARVRLAQKEAELSGAELAVQINANGTISRDKLSAKSIYPPPFAGSIVNQGQATLDFSYDFDFWGRNRAALESSLSIVAAKKAEARAARLILAASVCQNYLELQKNFAILAVENSLLKERQEYLDLTNSLSRNGIESEAKVHEAQMRLSEEKLKTVKIEEEIVLEKHMIASLLGKEPESGEKIVPSTATRADMPKKIPADMLGSRPDILAQKMRIEAADAGSKQARAEFYPDINLSAFAGLQSIGLGNFDQGQMASIGPAIHLPIYGGGRLRANLGAKYAQYDIAVEIYNQTVISAMREIADASTSLEAICRQIAAQREKLAASAASKNMALSQYEAGISSRQSFLAVEEKWLAQKMEQTELETKRLQIILAMIKALGGIPG